MFYLMMAIASLIDAPQSHSAATHPSAPLVVSLADDTKVVAEASLLMDMGPAMTSGDISDIDAITGRRIYRLILKPGEKIQVDLTCQKPGKIFMQWMLPPKVGAMRPELQRANMPPRAVRSGVIRLVNSTKEPFDAALVCLGGHNYPYTLTLTRN